MGGFITIIVVILLSVLDHQLQLGLKPRKPVAKADLYVPMPNPGALKQIAELASKRAYTKAYLIKHMTEISHAVWFTGISTQVIDDDVGGIIRDAAAQDGMPILVPYNIPFRDCGQYSAGGATTVTDYMTWINGFAKGIGDQAAIIILEPDSLGIIPYHTDLKGNLEPCQPSQANPETASAERFLMLNYAVDVFKSLPNVHVYLDGTNSRWATPGEISYRLVQAGVLKADGFFLNVSNYQSNNELIKYGTWVSMCIWYGSEPNSSGYGHYEMCANQYDPAKVDHFSTWKLTDQWYRDNVEKQDIFPGESGLTHFVLDTSRNGKGRWIPTKNAYPDVQDWCNAPGRGLGARPTTKTRQPLVDAYLWIKIPGESDGECTRGLGPPASTIDPEWGLIDPASGSWFPEMALDLAKNAHPTLLRYVYIQGSR